ncbi:hypothetical protein [Candidatus Poriferisodalis sp.]|uniref:hypothetical protein n=1 Tax=Candidatus Poriferisodalis sp. TaxID=3101277 RepID=UPI003B02695F
MKRRADVGAARSSRRRPAAVTPRVERDRHRRRRDRASRGQGAPWHFWLVVVMATVYLGWRAVEGVVWLVQWIAGGFGVA